VREVPCPQCGEILGVPPEFARGPIRCGACGRIIEAHEHSPGGSAAPPSAPKPRYDDADANESRNTRLDDEGDGPKRREKPAVSTGGGRSMFRVIATLLVIFGILTAGCCGCGGFLAWQVLKPTWEPFTAADFTIVFPRPPESERKSFTRADGTKGTLQQYNSILMLQQQVFVLLIDDLPKEARGGAVWREAQLNGMIDELKKAGLLGFKETARRDATVGGMPGREVDGTGMHPQFGPVSITVRLVIANRKVYALVALGKDAAKLEANKSRYFESFQLREPDAPKE